MYNLGETLRSLRRERFLTQRQVADVMGITQAAVSMHETGERSPSTKGLEKLAEHYHLRSDLFEGRSVFLKHQIEQTMKDFTPSELNQVLSFIYTMTGPGRKK